MHFYFLLYQIAPFITPLFSCTCHNKRGVIWVLSVAFINERNERLLQMI